MPNLPHKQMQQTATLKEAMLITISCGSLLKKGVDLRLFPEKVTGNTIETVQVFVFVEYVFGGYEGIETNKRQLAEEEELTT